MNEPIRRKKKPEDCLHLTLFPCPVDGQEECWECGERFLADPECPGCYPA